MDRRSCKGCKFAEWERNKAGQLHPEIQRLLRETGDAKLIEDCSKRQRGNGLFWGAAWSPTGWYGENWLGRIWMDTRREYR